MDFSNISRQLNEGMKSKGYKAPKVPGNLQDKDREEKLASFSPERPIKGGRNWMKEGMESVEAAQSSAEKAVASGDKQIQVHKVIISSGSSVLRSILKYNVVFLGLVSTFLVSSI